MVPKISLTSGRWLVAAFLSSIYVASGVHKLLSPMWSGGFGVLAPMTLPSLVWIDLSWISSLPHWFWRSAGYSVVVFELLFPLLYVWQRTRLPLLVVGIAMHAAFGIVYPIPIFAGVMLSLYAALLLPELLHEAMPPIPWNRRSIALLGLWALAVLNAYQPPLKALRKVVYIATGIASHTVFEDEAFLRYTYQVRLVTPSHSAQEA
jgi:hypothetical protein